MFILVLLGGILVLFVYMARLAANEKFFLSNKVWLLPFVPFLPQFLIEELSSPITSKELGPIYSSVSSLNTILAVFYLLFRLLVVVFLITPFKRPLRPNP